MSRYSRQGGYQRDMPPLPELPPPPPPPPTPQEAVEDGANIVADTMDAVDNSLQHGPLTVVKKAGHSIAQQVRD